MKRRKHKRRDAEAFWSAVWAQLIIALAYKTW